MLSERLRALRRVAVICIIVSLSVTALIGIATLLGGDFGEVQGKIMMTTLVIGTFSVLALADLAVAGRRFEWSGYVGILAAFIGLVMGLYLVWAESDPGKTFWKTFGITCGGGRKPRACEPLVASRRTPSASRANQPLDYGRFDRRTCRDDHRASWSRTATFPATHTSG